MKEKICQKDKNSSHNCSIDDKQGVKSKESNYLLLINLYLFVNIIHAVSYHNYSFASKEYFLDSSVTMKRQSVEEKFRDFRKQVESSSDF